MKKLFAAVLFTAVLPAVAVAQNYQAGVHYQVLETPVRTANPEKIEVNEVFAYTCIHCWNFESKINPWKQTLADDVDFRRTPVVWADGDPTEQLARAYYMADVALKEGDNIHKLLFRSVQEEKKLPRKKDDVIDLFVSYGIDKAKAESAYNNFSVASQVQLAKSRVKGYKIEGTPEVIVNGKYRISTTMAGNHDNVLKVVDYLIAKERAAK